MERPAGIPKGRFGDCAPLDRRAVEEMAHGTTVNGMPSPLNIWTELMIDAAASLTQMRP
jgi:hypothetical protein